jgi:hypothetical protein
LSESEVAVADNLVEVGRNLQHFLERLIEVARAVEIMEGQNESGMVAQACNRFRLRFQRALEFKIDNLTAGGVRLGQNFQLRRERSLELATILGATAGAHRDDILVSFKKTVDLGKRGQGLFQVIQTKLEKGVIPSHGLGGSEQILDRIAAEREADFRQALGQKTGRDRSR